MNPDDPRTRIVRRAIAVTIAVVSIAAASLAAPAPAVDSE